MKCLNLTDIQYNFTDNQFDHLVRADHIYIGSKIESNEQIDFLKTLKIESVIDLKKREETSFKDKEQFEEVGINYFNLPITNFNYLNFETLQTFGTIISQNENRMFIYCMSGNRAGALLALNTCLICGHPKDRALNFGEKVGMKQAGTKKIISDLLEKGRIA